MEFRAPPDDQIFYIIKSSARSRQIYAYKDGNKNRFVCIFSKPERARELLLAKFLNCQCYPIEWADLVDRFSWQFDGFVIDAVPGESCQLVFFEEAVK